MEFTGHVSNGKKEGIGSYYDGKIFFHGTFNKDQRSGFGMIWYLDEIEGGPDIFSIKKGTEQDSEDELDNLRPTIFKGGFKDDRFDGEGIAKLQDGSYLVCQFENGKVRINSDIMWLRS